MFSCKYSQIKEIFEELGFFINNWKELYNILYEIELVVIKREHVLEYKSLSYYNFLRYKNKYVNLRTKKIFTGEEVFKEIAYFFTKRELERIKQISTKNPDRIKSEVEHYYNKMMTCEDIRRNMEVFYFSGFENLSNNPSFEVEVRFSRQPKKDNKFYFDDIESIVELFWRDKTKEEIVNRIAKIEVFPYSDKDTLFAVRHYEEFYLQMTKEDYSETTYLNLKDVVDKEEM